MREKEISCGTLGCDFFFFYNIIFAHARESPFHIPHYLPCKQELLQESLALNIRGRAIPPLPAPGVTQPVTFPERNSSACAGRKLCFLDRFKALPCQRDYRSRGNVGVSEASPKRHGGCSAPVRHWGCFYLRIFRRI